MRPFTTILLLSLISLLSPGLRAQSDKYRFSRLDISQGLSHNEVNCLFRDEKGFLWIGTMSGLNRYDGYKFKIFKHDLRDTTSISDDYIEKIYEGPGHYLYVFTRNGINRYDPLTEKFDRNAGKFMQDLRIPVGNIVGNITDIKKDKAGNFWFLSATSGIYQYDPSKDRTSRYFHREGDPSSPCSDNITSIAPDTAGDWWIAYRNGMMEKMDGATHRIVQRSKALKDLSPGDSLDYRLYIDRQNDCWLYAPGSSKGIFYFNPSTDAVRHIEMERSRSIGKGSWSLNTDLINGILQDEKGRVWIATDHGGINLLDKKDFSIRYLLNREDDNKSISQNSINTLYQDKEGIVWIGTFKKGLSCYQENGMRFPLYRHGLPNARNLNYDDVNRFVEDPKGNLWIGTNGGGLLYFNRRTGGFTQYLHNPSDGASLSNDVIVSLCLDHEQKLWIGTYYGGLDCFDGKRFRHYRHRQNDTSSIADDRIWEILEDSRHRLWIGTFSKGLDLFDREKNSFHHYPPFTPNSLQSGYITGLMEDSRGDLWIATAYGIDVLDHASGLFRHYGHDALRPATSLSNNNTIGACEDARGLIWIATREGLNVFDPRRGVFKIFRTEDGLPNNTLVDILQDNDHNIWVSTPNGLSEVLVSLDSATRQVTCRFRNYDESDGLQGREFNENAALKTRSGELIFGGANGFNIFDPRMIRSESKGPSLTLTDFQVFNRSVGIGEILQGRVVLQQSISTAKEITLRYNENVFSLEFAALDFFNPEKVRYAYQLEGFNHQWLMADDKTRKATFTNLDPGNYTFKVRTANDRGDWNPEELSLAIKILPPFWKTPLAYVIYGLLFIAVLLVARKMILQKARTRFALEQERQEAQRLHELDMMKIRFFTNVSHEFRTPLSLILTPLDKIIRDTENPDRKNQFRLIHRNARRLLNMVNQLLDFRKLEEQELRITLSPGDIVKFIRELSFSFADMAQKKNIDFVFHSSLASFPTSFDQDKLERILFNLLSNAFKFTPEKGKVTVELSLLPVPAAPIAPDIALSSGPSIVSPDTELQSPAASPDARPDSHFLLRLSVKDTGIGIEKDKQDKIFERFFQDELPGHIINQGSGIGLAITREFVKLHNGSIYVESVPGKGSNFIVSLPVTRIDLPVAATQPPQEDPIFLPPRDDAAAPPITPISQPSKKPVLLLVEDSEDLRSYLKDNLQEFFTILEAANGREGWQKTLGAHPDLVISDISMPEMNGIDLCRKIKTDKRTSFVPVILLTALTGEEQQLKGLETGANDYVTKPFNVDILLSKVRNLLQQQEIARKTWQKQVEVNPVRTTATSPDEQFIQHALEIMERNISNADFSVEDMGRELFISRVGLYKRILALTGKTPIEFIRSFRLKRAAQLLAMSRFTVAEIAYECGFNNPKYFSRYFKTEFGMLPSAYQAKKRQEADASL